VKKRIICFALAAAMLMSTNVFAAASVVRILPSGTKLSSSSTKTATTVNAETTDSLTIETAVEKAIANSSKLKTLDENKDLSETDFKNTSTSLTNYDSDDNGSNNYLNLAVQYKRLAISLKNYDATTEVTKKQLEQSIREYFVAIVEAQNAIELYEQNMEIQQKEIDIAKVKLDLGLISQSEYDSSVTSFNTLKSNRDTLKNNLDTAYSTLNVILGYDTKTRYELEYDCDYTAEIDNLNLTYIISKAQSSSYSITQKKNAVDIAKYDYEKYSLSTATDYSSETRDEKKATYAQATRDYGDAKDTIETTITNWYNSLKEAEQNYSDNLATLTLKKSQLAIYEKKYELGTITELELEKYKYEISQLENTIQNLKYSHDLLVRKLQDPDPDLTKFFSLIF
jgi:outer membrane protein TolC